MASFSFYYRSKNESGNLSLRFVHNGLDYTLRTPYVSHRLYWIYKSTKNGKAINKHRRLEELKGDANLKKHKETLLVFVNKLELSLLDGINNNVAISKEWLKEVISKHQTIIEGENEIKIESNKLNAEKKKQEETKTKNLLLKALEETFIKYKSNKDELKKVKTTHNWIEQYQREKNELFKIIDFNQRFVDNFKHWAIQDKNYKLSTTIGHLKRIKRAIEYVYLNDTEGIIFVHRQLSHLKFSNTLERESLKDKIVITLDFNELDKLDRLDLGNNKDLIEIKKCILIGCETGLRFLDFNQLNNANLKISMDNIEYWEFRMQKTKKWVQIVKTHRLNNLIKKYGEPKTNYTENEDVSINRKVKKICKLAGIDNEVEGDLSQSIKVDSSKTRRIERGFYPKYKLITTRTFRRSFATNYYGKINIELILQVTGHTNEKMLREYINVHDDRNISIGFDKMNEYHEKRKDTKLRKISNQ